MVFCQIIFLPLLFDQRRASLMASNQSALSRPSAAAVSRSTPDSGAKKNSLLSHGKYRVSANNPSVTPVTLHSVRLGTRSDAHSVALPVRLRKNQRFIDW